jgi:hypothetical protein
VFPNQLYLTKKKTCGRCDRILWRGEGVEQVWYTRGESRFSDHRPVASLFTARIDVVNKHHPRPAGAGGDDVDSAGKSRGLSSFRRPPTRAVGAQEMLLLVLRRSTTTTLPRSSGF